jgi:DNA-binding NtrC family response regulator
MHSKTEQILFVCSPSKTLQALEEVLLAKLLFPIVAVTLQDAEPILTQKPLALIICASELIDGTYRDLLHSLARVGRSVPVIVVSMMAREEECEEARKLGAVDCMPRPMAMDEVQSLANKALEVISRQAQQPPH